MVLRTGITKEARRERLSVKLCYTINLNAYLSRSVGPAPEKHYFWSKALHF
jgi:hypothetical protein